MFKNQPAYKDVEKVIKERVKQNDLRLYRYNSIMGILFCYIIIASIDFGAGFFALHSKMTGNEKKVNHLIHRYLNPVWEVTNVFFVFFL